MGLGLFYEWNAQISDFKFIQRTSGKITLMVKSYTYYRTKIQYGTIRWRCSSTKKSKCHSFVITCENENGYHRVMKMNLDHNHRPPRLSLTHDGKYSSKHADSPCSPSPAYSWRLPSPVRLASDIMTTANVGASMLPKFNY